MKPSVKKIADRKQEAGDRKQNMLAEIRNLTMQLEREYWKNIGKIELLEEMIKDETDK